MIIHDNRMQFKIYSRLINKQLLDETFIKIYNLLKAEADENIYEYKELNNPNEEIDKFFNSKINEKYKFLVINNGKELIILGNLDSTIFNKETANEIYDIFYNIKSDDELLNYGEYVKFYKVKSGVNKSFKTKLKHTFNPDFYMAIISLYLSRINQTRGTILKTNKGFIQIPYRKNINFSEYFNEIKDLTYYNIKGEGEELSNYIFNDLTAYNIELETANKILTFNLYDDYLEVVYNTDAFKEEYIKNMVANLEVLIDEAHKSPETKCKDINILSDDESKLLNEFAKGNTLDFDENKTVSHYLRENSLKYPNNISIDDGENKITFKELEYLSNSIAYDLKTNYNIKENDIVGLLLPRDYHFVEIVFALNKINAIHIPIDMSFPTKRIEHMLKVAETDIIITTKNQDIPNTQIIYSEDLKRNYEEEIQIKSTGEDLFNIMFTSGTSDLPKGVEITNNQLVNNILSLDELIKTEHTDIFGFYVSPAFVASFTLYWSIILGFTSRIFNNNEIKDINLVIKELKEKNFTNIILPTKLGMYIYETETTKLKHLIIAGAKINHLKKKENDTKIVNFYGTTETIASCIKIYDLKEKNEKATIGKPLSNFDIYILDKDLNRLPIGVPGEIYIAGNYISPGYINNPLKTKEVFLENPFDCKPIYKTGDIGLYNFDGEIEIIGREDNQLSLRGFRIESEEISGILNSFPEINDAVLDIYKDNLILYYSSKEPVNEEDIKNRIKEYLPPYMVPSFFKRLDTIPRNDNGKVDYSNLPKININKNIAPKTDLEKEVYRICSNILNSEEFGITDNLLYQGFNSLNLLKLKIKIKKKYKLNFEVSDFNEELTIQNIVKFILEKESSVFQQEKVKYEKQDYYPLPPFHQMIVQDYIKHPYSHFYTLWFLIDLPKILPTKLLKKSLISLCNLNPILKARIIKKDNAYCCYIDNNADLNKIIKIVETDDLKKEIEKYNKPFDLFNENLFRFIIFKTPEGNKLFLKLSHCVCDGASIELLVKDLIKIFARLGSTFAFKSNEKINYTDYILVLNHLEKSARNQKIVKKYNDLFDGYDLIKFNAKTDKYVYGDVESVTRTVDASEIVKFCEDNNISINLFLISSILLNLKKYSFNDKVILPMTYNGRNELTQFTTGCLMHFVPFKSDKLNKNQSLKSFLNNMNKTMMEIILNEPNSFAFYPKNSILYNFFEINMNLDSKHLDEFNLVPNANSIVPPREFSKTDIDFIAITKIGNIIKFEIIYRKELFESEEMNKCLDDIITITEKIINADLDTPIREVTKTN